MQSIGSERGPHDTRAQLLEAAKRVFARHGFESATVKEVAEEAGVNVSLISYYFGGKEGLYRNCLETFGQERLEAARRALQPAETREELRARLRTFFEELLTVHVEQSDLTTMIHREYASGLSIMHDRYQAIFGQIFLALREFIEHAQRAGLIDPAVDAHAVTTLSFGSMMNLSRVDSYHQEFFGKSLSDPAYRKQIIELTTRMFFETLVIR
jgi:AcrR family transcriptional regulator